MTCQKGIAYWTHILEFPKLARLEKAPMVMALPCYYDYNVERSNAIYKGLELNYDVFDCCIYSGMIYIKFIYLVAHI